MRKINLFILSFLSCFVFAQQNNVHVMNYANVFNNNIQVETRGNQSAQLYANNKIVQRNITQAANRNIAKPKTTQRMAIPQVNRVTQIKNINNNPINRVNAVTQVNDEPEQQSSGNINENISDNNVDNNYQNIEINYAVQQENDAPVQAQAVNQSNVSDRNFSLDINLPKINFKPVKYAGSSSSKSSSGKSFYFKKKLSKMNRKMHSKFAFTKKLKMKVDLCCNW